MQEDKDLTYYFVSLIFSIAVAGIAQWIERQLANRKVPGSIPSRGTCLSGGPGPSWGHVRGKESMFLSISFSLPSFLSKNK